jgi:uncharacterized protein YuzE
MTSTGIELRVDQTSDAAYIVLSDKTVARTKTLTDAVQVDLDEFGVAVGIEVLTLDAEIPFSRLVADFHVPSNAIDLLRYVQPSVSGFLITHATDGTVESTDPISAGERVT